MKLNVNNKEHELDVDSNMPISYVLRDILGLTGTKYGCGVAQCGSCTIHIGGIAIRSCMTPVSQVGSQEITTIEGLGNNDKLHPLQEAWLEHDVAQCGYCQSGQIMNAASLLNSNENPSDEQIEAAMSGNICRCGTYTRIKQAIKTAASNS